MGNSLDADEDAKRYRDGYPGNREDELTLRANIDFFENTIPSRPRGEYISYIHEHWFGDYRELEVNHSYIQWIFPIREDGMNYQSQRLQPHELKHIRSRPALQKRLIKSYEMMLDFYGMEIANRETGEIKRAKNWKHRYRHLSNSFHNYLRITRILKCLGELGYEKYKAPLVEHILNEIKNHRQLLPCFRSCADYWIPVIRGDEERARLAAFAKELVDSGIVSHRSAYRRRRRRSSSPKRPASDFKPFKKGTRVKANWQSNEYTCDVVGWDQAKGCYKVRADGEAKWFRAKVADVRLLNPPPPTTNDGENKASNPDGSSDMEDSQDVEGNDDESAQNGDSMEISGITEDDDDKPDSTQSSSSSSSSKEKSGSKDQAAKEESADDPESRPKALKQQKIDNFFEKK